MIVLSACVFQHYVNKSFFVTFVVFALQHFCLIIGNICPNPGVGKEVMKIYNDTFNDFNHDCLNPCSFVTTNTYTISDEDFNVKGKETMSFININLKQTIEVNLEQRLYDGLTFLSQLGGYFGLFLGVSIIQINMILGKNVSLI